MEDYDFAQDLAVMDDVATGSKLLPEADYNWIVRAAEVKMTSNGNPKIMLRLENLDGPYRGTSVIHDIIYSNRTTQGVQFFWRQMTVLGITSEWSRATGNTSMKDMAARTVSVQFTASVVHEEWQEQVRVKLRFKKIIGINPNLGASATRQETAAASTLPPLEEDAVEESELQTVPPTEDDPWGVGTGE